MLRFLLLASPFLIKIMLPRTNSGPGQLSRYSDSLRAGRPGDRIQVGARFSAPVQTGPEAHPASCIMGTGSFPVVKRPGRGFDHPTHLVVVIIIIGLTGLCKALPPHPHIVPRLKKEQSFTSAPPLGLRGLFQGELYLLPFYQELRNR